MFDKTKTESYLGEMVDNLLKDKGINNPCVENGFTEETKIEQIASHMEQVLYILGLDNNDESIKDTPKRVAKMWVKERFWGLNPNNFPKVMTIPNDMKYNQMLVEKNIPVVSSCEHHLADIVGKCSVAYIPHRKVIGLSKLNRIVEYFSHRPQVQERLTQQILEALKYILETDNVAVSIVATHNCVRCRGVEHLECETTTNALSGVFLENEIVRAEFNRFVF